MSKILFQLKSRQRRSARMQLNSNNFKLKKRRKKKRRLHKLMLVRMQNNQL